MLATLILNFLPVIISGIIIYMIYYLSTSMRSGEGALSGICFFIVNPPSIDILVTYILQSAMAAVALICSFTGVSNHIVLSLDIISTFSFLMLVFYHNFKQPHNLSVSQNQANTYTVVQ